MFTILSLVTSVKDYLEVVHKLIEVDSINLISNYNDFGSMFTFFILSLKNVMVDLFSLNWLKNIWSLPIVVPEISSAMISEISVLDGYFHNAFNFLDTPLTYGEQNSFFYCLEKFTIGLINSLFLFLPTSTAHIITLRRFVMQGLEAGYISGLGTLAGNMLWLTSVILGWRFFVIPWLSLDILRYLLGFILLVKYMWDSYNERKMVLEDVSKQKIFLLNFLLALTEQTSLYPFLSNLSLNPEASLLESFAADSYSQFIFVHLAYLTGILLGSLSLLHFTCWFWENPAFKFYMWIISSEQKWFKVSTSFYYKALNFTFLYLTMISAITSIPYYGLDYTITNPLGLVQDDRIVQDKTVLETSFLGTKASDRNTRRNRGRHGRRERWKRRIRKYRTFDASLYDQGIYDLFTIEDLNYGFDRFWLRRKLRNHRVRFRFFPGPWMRTFKKQLAKPRLESYTGPRVEFFRILFEQVYHPSFHAYNETSTQSAQVKNKQLISQNSLLSSNPNLLTNSVTGVTLKSNLAKNTQLLTQQSWVNAAKKGNAILSENSMLRKFARKFTKRIRVSQIANTINNIDQATFNAASAPFGGGKRGENKSLYSKTLKEVAREKDASITSLQTTQNSELKGLLRNFYQNALNGNSLNQAGSMNLAKKQTTALNYARTRDMQILRYRTLLFAAPKGGENSNTGLSQKNQNNPGVLLHPLKYYLQKQKAFERKLRYYTPSVFRKFTIENNAPYFRVILKRYFYNYKPNLRWERTMKVASLRKARRKTTRSERKTDSVFLTTLASKGLDAKVDGNNGLTGQESTNLTNSGRYAPGTNDIIVLNTGKQLTTPTHNYTVVGKKASRYRYQIYKDVLQHWYYSPFNRLLLKLDVDNFIRRQPNSHFLTSKEENLLHLRRFLLSEHYNTLRWYTNMEHYRTMKTKIGGTKSFASRSYNQQFAGTFKKIRHLFAITPSQVSEVNSTNVGPNQNNDNNKVVLKFDQPLFNEYTNTKEKPLVNSLIIHEELLPDYTTNSQNSSLGGGAGTQTQQIVRDYLIQSNPIRENYIKQLLSENNYTDFTQFIYTGQKLQGLVTPYKGLGNVDQNALRFSQPNNVGTKQPLMDKTSRLSNLVYHSEEDFYFNLLQQFKRRINNQEFLKNYLSRRIEKREKRQQKKQKHLLNKLKYLENFYSQGSPNPYGVSSGSLQIVSSLQTKEGDRVPIALNGSQFNSNVTLGVQKSILDGFYTVNNIDSKTSTVQEKSLWKLLLIHKLNSGAYKVEERKPQPTNSILTYSNLKNIQIQKSLSDFKTNVNTLTNVIQKIQQKPLKARGLYKGEALSSKITRLKVEGLIKQINQVSIRLRRTVPKYLGIDRLVNLLKPIKRQSLKQWRSKERSLTKQKRLRKELKNLKPSGPVPGGSGTKTDGLKTTKNGQSIILIKTESSQSKQNEISTLNLPISPLTNPVRKKRASESSETSSWKTFLRTNYEKVFSFVGRAGKNKNFKRKRSPQRRTRGRPGRAMLKKRTLNETFKQNIKSLYNQKDTTLLQDPNVKEKFYTTLQLYSKNSMPRPFPKGAGSGAKTDENLFVLKQLKQRKSKQRKQRFWKQKRSKFAQKRRKYRKRRRYAIGKIRVLSKQFKKIQSKIELQNWWWKQYLPNIQATTNALWQLEKDRLLQQKLSEFSNLKESNLLQIETKDFKPLALNSTSLMEQTTKEPFGYDGSSNSIQSNGSFDLINQLYENIYLNKTTNVNLLENKPNQFSPFMNSNTTLPFYAGWDETLRKFVVTNRMLSRQDAGYEFKTLDATTSIPSLKTLKVDSENTQNSILFTSAPLQGMNAATTLYWQIPFTTYDPDQFFALGMDGFSPIGWRKFQFRHSILKSWLYNISNSNASSNINTGFKELSSQIRKNGTQDNLASLNKTSFVIGAKKGLFTNTVTNNFNTEEPKNGLIYTLKQKTNSTLKQGAATYPVGVRAAKINDFNSYPRVLKNTSRRLKKRYRRVKKHPRTPVWFPSGPLMNQVLPVHYIYVFYKRSRLPRDRYLKRRLLNTKAVNQLRESYFEPLTAQNPPLDFTLRKRVKPKRKYHRKRTAGLKTLVIPRRLKFFGSENEPMRWRPLSTKKITKPISELIKEQKALKAKQRRKTGLGGGAGTQTNMLRVKQLRRRVQRQIIRTVWRYRPRAGGFVWPGDYLKLETVKAPLLKQSNEFAQIDINKRSSREATRKISKRKKKRTLPEWQIQPKKYLLEKHNLKVLKKKLEKTGKLNP
jgi:hypothetical protein